MTSKTYVVKYIFLNLFLSSGYCNGSGDKYSENGTVTSYSYGAGIDVANETVGTDVKTHFGGLAEAIGTTSSLGTFRYLMHDDLGSTREVRDGSTGLLAEFAYGPYGDSYFAQEAAFAQTNPDIDHVTRRFTGHDLNLTSGLYNTPFRTYSPTTARWLTPDPLGMVDGPNMYAYVAGNPINLTDPLGLSYLVFDRSISRIFAFSRTGKPLGSWSAANRTPGYSPWPQGFFRYQRHTTHADDGPNSSYGTYGNFIFDVSRFGRTDMGVHSGRANTSRGYMHGTQGCIRTTDDATASIRRIHYGPPGRRDLADPLTSIVVIDQEMRELLYGLATLGIR